MRADYMAARIAGCGTPAPSTTWRLLCRQAERRPNAPFLIAPNRRDLSYRDARGEVRRFAGLLAGMGLQRGDVVLQLVADGAEAALCYLALSAATSCCAVNAELGGEQLERFFRLVGAKAAVAQRGIADRAAEVVRRLGLPVMWLEPRTGGAAGTFDLSGDLGTPAEAGEFARTSDIALVLQTSGTTGPPKAVPLTHSNITICARWIANAQRLTPEDRWLGGARFFHTHTLVGGILSSLVSGGSAVCPGRFDVARFSEWLDLTRPTWFSSVPTVHMALAARAQAHVEVVRRRPLRFIRSGGAALDVETWRRLEEVFRCPVIVSYGMTECSPRLTHNPLPPSERKRASVGLSVGPDIAVMDGNDLLLPRGGVGEVVVRGPSVMGGYLNDPAANAQVFFDGWLRTGDLGYIDQDGYVFLTGRKKEAINHGGEMISPWEIDHALLAHPAVRHAAAFGAPHRQFGEEVQAAVVLQENAAATEEELMEHCAGRLVDFKVPRRVHFVEGMPLGPTGKVQRRALAEQLVRRPSEPSDTGESDRSYESAVMQVWAELLETPPRDPRDNFFDLGGDSMAAARFLHRVEGITGIHLLPAVFFADPTPKGVARALRRRLDSADPPPLVPFRPHGGKTPFFFVVPALPWALFDLSRLLDDDRPFYAIHPLGFVDHENPKVDLEDLARRYIDCIREVRPTGPYIVGGVSSGGRVAWEMAQRLRAAGEEVELLVLVDVLRRRTFIPTFWGIHARLSSLVDSAIRFSRRSGRENAQVLQGAVRRLLSRLRGGAGSERRAHRTHAVVRRQVLDLVAAHRDAFRHYEMRPYPGRVAYFWAEGTRILSLSDPRKGWDDLAVGELQTYRVPGAHDRTLVPPNVEEFAEKLRTCLSGLDSSDGPAASTGIDSAPSRE